MHGLVQTIFVHILIVNSICDAVERFLLVFIRFKNKKTTNFLSHRAAREITPTRLVICRAAREITPTRRVICRADMGVHAWALPKNSCTYWVLIVSSKCDAVGSFTVCIYQFLKTSNKFSYLSSCSRNNADLARYLSSRSGRA